MVKERGGGVIKQYIIWLTPVYVAYVFEIKQNQGLNPKLTFSWYWKKKYEYERSLRTQVIT